MTLHLLPHLRMFDYHSVCIVCSDTRGIPVDSFKPNIFRCQNLEVFVLLPCLHVFIKAYLRAPPLPPLLFCFLYHLPLCWLFSLPLDILFHLYHWLCCQLIYWCLPVNWWYCRRCYFLFRMYIILILHYHYTTCLLYIWCILRIMRHLFECFNLQFIHCFYLEPLHHLYLTEFDCFQVW